MKLYGRYIYIKPVTVGIRLHDKLIIYIIPL